MHLCPAKKYLLEVIPANTYQFKVNNTNMRKRCEIMLKVNSKDTTTTSMTWSDVANYEHISQLFLVFKMFTLTVYLLADWLRILYYNSFWSHYGSFGGVCAGRTENIVSINTCLLPAQDCNVILPLSFPYFILNLPDFEKEISYYSNNPIFVGYYRYLCAWFIHHLPVQFIPSTASCTLININKLNYIKIVLIGQKWKIADYRNLIPSKILLLN